MPGTIKPISYGESFLSFLRKAGGTLTGALFLFGNATSALMAVPRQQLSEEVLDTITVSGETSQTITFSDYDGYTDFTDLKVSIRRLVPGTDDKQVYLQLNADTGTTYNLVGQINRAAGAGNKVLSGQTQLAFGDTAAGVAFGTNTGEGGEIDIELLDFQDTTLYHNVRYRVTAQNAVPEVYNEIGGGTWKSTAAVTSAKISMESGGTFSCTITISGRR